MSNHRTKDTVRIVIGSLDIGGTETHLSRILPRLKSDKLTPVVITLTHRGQLADGLQSLGIPVYEPPLIVRFTQRIPYLRRVIGPVTTILYLITQFIRTPARVTCFYLPSSYFLGMIAAVMTGSTGRTLMFRRSLNVYQDNWPFIRSLEPLLHKLTGAIAGNSQAVIRQLRDEEGVPAHKLTLIYNGIDLPTVTAIPVRAGIRNKLDIAEDVIVLSIVANLIPYKGHADLLAALSRISDKMDHPWLLLCAGSGIEQRQDLTDLVKQYNLSDKVRWLGQRQDVPDILCASDIGLLVSHHEGFSNSVLEGMAAGLPMIVTAVGGNPEAIIDHECGLVVPPRDPVALAKAILYLANNLETARKYGIAAKDRVRTAFSMDSCLESYRQLLGEMMSK